MSRGRRQRIVLRSEPSEFAMINSAPCSHPPCVTSQNQVRGVRRLGANRSWVFAFAAAGGLLLACGDDVSVGSEADGGAGTSAGGVGGNAGTSSGGVGGDLVGGSTSGGSAAGGSVAG